MTSLDDHGQPWQGVPAVVPGTVQAEEFDEGGEGVAYSDSSEGNNKGVRAWLCMIVVEVSISGCLMLRLLFV